MISSNQKNGGGDCGDQIEKFKQEKSMKKANPDGLNKAPIQSPSKVTNELPNYKKSTSRFDASKNKLQVSTSFLTSSSKMKTMNNSENSASSKRVSSSDHPESKAFAKDQVRNSGLRPARSSMKKNSGVGVHSTVNLSRSTSSSAAKIHRNPESLDLDETNGVSSQKLCSYKYCSLHGQKKNEASLPPLKCFFSARRPTVKLPNSFKRKEESSTSKNGRKEIYSKQQSFEEIVDIVNGINGMIMEDYSYQTNQLQESYSVTSFEDYADKNSEISIEELKVFDESIQHTEAEKQEEAREHGGGHEIQLSTAFSYDKGEDSEESTKGTAEEQHDMKAIVENEAQQGRRSNNDDGLINEKEKSKCSASFISENPFAELTNRPKPIYSTTRKITEENNENERAFNPRPLRFLPLKPEPEAEMVNLKHQTVDERKPAEEWMIDYALQKTLRRMAPARKRKVALLIAAFESVIQQEQCTTAP